MRKYLLFIFFIPVIILSDSNYELKLFEKIFPLIFSYHEIIIYADKDSEDIIKNSSTLQLYNDCNSAELVMAKNLNKLEAECKNLPYFATRYKSYINSKNSIGAFYWRKGRPQLKLNAKNLKKFNLNLPDSLKKYAQ